MGDLESVVGTVLLVGELLLTSGAEIYRVEETTERVGKAAGFSQAEVFATPTGIFLSLLSPQGTVFTRVRRIRLIDNNLARIAKVNSLSRQFEQGKPLVEFAAELQEIKNEHLTYGFRISLAGGFGSGAFAVIFGGTVIEAVVAAGIGLLVLLFLATFARFPAPRFISSALASALAASLGLIGQAGFGLTADILILAGVMVLVPGVTMTTAVRDMLSGELVSGVARGAEALTIAVAVAVGVAVVLGLGGV